MKSLPLALVDYILKIVNFVLKMMIRFAKHDGAGGPGAAHGK